MDKPHWLIVDGKQGAGWLDDTIIDFAQEILSEQFPSIGCLQSCLLAEKNMLQPVENRQFVQIINTDVKNGEHHWIVVSRNDDDVPHTERLNNSLAPRITSNLEQTIANIMTTDEDFIEVQVTPCDKQLNACACGIYAIAIVGELKMFHMEGN